MTSEACFTVSAFGDEISPDLDEQLRVMRELNIGHLDLRSAWGKNVLQMDDAEVSKLGRICTDRGVRISCIASPIGKSALAEPVEAETANLARIFQIAEALGTPRVRVFSFYPPDTSTNARYDAHVPEAVARLARLAEMAQHAGFALLLENEKAIVGDTLARCHQLVEGVSSPALRFLWDPANFVQVGEVEPTTRGWPLLGTYVGYVHIKDARLSDGSVVPAGAGDGQVAELLARLNSVGYCGFVALEPHLAVAGHSGGFSGADGMARAAESLRALLRHVGCVEADSPATN